MKQDKRAQPQRYTSKRNVVFNNGGRVYKCHKNAADAKAEARFLRLLAEAGVRVPHPHHCVGRVLVMQPVPGRPLPELLCTAAATFEVELVAQGLVYWMQAFYAAVRHHATGENRGDVNGRNFLVDGETVWGLDFEAHCYGTREEDFGRLAAFIECYDGCDEKRAKQLSAAVTARGILQLGLDAALLESERQKERAAMAQRRKSRAHKEK